MNEQIEKLALQAGMHRDKFGMYFAGDKHNEDGVDLEKFAELIVKECAGVAEVSMPINSHPDDRLTVKNNVLKHFGIEE